MSRVVVVGAGGHAREVADVVRACRADGREIELVGFVDDDPGMAGVTLCDVPVLGTSAWLTERTDEYVAVCGLGTPQVKRRVATQLQASGVRFISLIHPHAVVTDFVALGAGVVITAGCIVTNQVRLGDHVHLNRSVNVGHDCDVAAYAHIAPAAVLSGNVRVGEGCDIGTGAVVIQGVTIGEWAIVGAAAAVTRNLDANVTAVGVPARVIKQRSPGWHLPLG